MYCKQKLVLIIAAMLVTSTLFAAIPFGFSTIINRPALYFDNTTADSLPVDAGSYINITTSAMTITGA